MKITIDRKYLFHQCTVNKKVCWGEDIEMSTWIDKNKTVHYIYWLYLDMPRYFEMKL